MRARRAVSRAFQRARASLRSEDDRLREHFRGALALLDAADTSRLSVAQRRARAAATATLRGYAARGRFPRNRRFPGALVPVFIDTAGTRCAVAHLVERSGHADVAQGVRISANNALVRELASNAELVAWADASGLTLAELARIQPSYECYPRAEDCVCPGREGGQVVELMLVPGNNAAEVVAVHSKGILEVGGAVSVGGGQQDSGRVLATYYSDGAYVSLSGKLDAADPTKIDLYGTSCADGPALSTKTLLGALVASSEGADPSTCSDTLGDVDGYWTEQTFYGDDSSCGALGGCSIGAPASGPFVFTALALGVAMWMQRRRARRAAWKRRSSRT